MNIYNTDNNGYEKYSTIKKHIINYNICFSFFNNFSCPRNCITNSCKERKRLLKMRRKI